MIDCACRSFAASVCAIAALVGLYTAPSAFAGSSTNDAPCDGQGTLLCPTPTDDGYEYIYDPTTDVMVPVPTGKFPKQPGVTYQYDVTPACPTAQAGDAINCTEAGEFCRLNGSTGIHEDVWRRQTAPTTTPWRVVDHVCTGSGPPPIAAEQVVQDAGDYERDHMPIPVPNVQPGKIAIVNLPVLVSVNQPGPQRMQIQQPVPGLLVATPTYTWKFDDGTTLTGAGIPYDGTDPRADPGHYVSHTYTAAEAQASVTLTVTWNATFTAAGQVFTIPPLLMPPITTTFSVHEAHSVLVSGNE